MKNNPDVQIRFKLDASDYFRYQAGFKINHAWIHGYIKRFVRWISFILPRYFKGSSDPSRFIFVTNVGKSRTRHRTTPNLNDIIFNQFGVDLEIQFQSRCMSDQPLSDIDFKNIMVWDPNFGSELPLNRFSLIRVT